MRKDGHKPKRRPKPVESHYDDLGDDLSGLGEDVKMLYADLVEECLSDSDTDNSDDDHVASICHFAFFGRAGLREPPQSVMIAATIDKAADLLAQAGQGVDIVDLSGSDGHAATVAIRRRLVGGRNLDVSTQVDLGCPHEQEATLRYLKQNDVFVVAMALAYGSLSDGYDRWVANYRANL